MGKTAVIFCSASKIIDPKYNEEAKKVVRCLCSKGITIVSGGTTKGTMDVVAGEAAKYSNENIGIVPRFMADVLNPNLSRICWTETMSERKEKMRELGKDYAIALPGGIGTLDEFFETYVLAKLHLYSGKIIAYNYNGFYDSLKEMMDAYVEKGMLDSGSRALLHCPETIEELEELL